MIIVQLLSGNILNVNHCNFILLKIRHVTVIRNATNLPSIFRFDTKYFSEVKMIFDVYISTKLEKITHFLH